MIEWVLEFAVGLATGVLSGFGIGGGSLLILYLTSVAGVEQYLAGGINLLYFIFCAPAALVSHIKNKLIVWKAVLWCTVAGIVTSLGAAWLASAVHADWLRRAFGVLLLYIGVRELFCKKTVPTEEPERDLSAKDGDKCGR